MTEPLDIVKASQIKYQHYNIVYRHRGDLSRSIENIIRNAISMINDDVYEEFIYQYPGDIKRKYKTAQADKPLMSIKSRASKLILKTSSTTSTTESTASDEYRNIWVSIENFNIKTVVNQIRDYINTWELGTLYRFVVMATEVPRVIKPYGVRWNVEAHFSKPTPRCPNPLAVAKVFFQVNVSFLLPSNYPVMVTYHFEGYKTMYYALGRRKLTSLIFQRYLLDSILHMKLTFYNHLWECRNPLSKVQKRKLTPVSNFLMKNPNVNIIAK